MYRFKKVTMLTALPLAALSLAALAQDVSTSAASARPSFFQHMLQKMDTNGDGRISEQEFLAAATARFQSIDTQHTGSVDAAELASSPGAEQRLQQHANRIVKHLDTAGAGYITQDEVVAFAQRRFARLDKSGDGKLTPDELAPRFGRWAAAQNGVAATASTQTATAPTAAGPRAQFAQRRFDKLDTNHDGVVTQDEFVAAAVARFQALDTQGTGQVTAAEIVNSPKAQARVNRVAEHLVKRMDSNGDGAVSQDEFLAAAKKRFERMDKNGDGFIDADEIPAHRWAHGAKPTPSQG